MSTERAEASQIQTELAPEQRVPQQGEPASHGVARIFARMTAAIERLLAATDPVNPGRRYPTLDAISRGELVGPLPRRVILTVPADGTEGTVSQSFNSLTIVNTLAVPVFIWTEMGLAAAAAAGNIPSARVITIAAGAVVTAPIAGPAIWGAAASGGFEEASEIAAYAWPTVQPWTG